MSTEPAEFTQLLLQWSKGDRAALDALVPLVYDELRGIASRSLQRESAGHTLQTTALVHEAYLRLVEQDRVRWQNRTQFFAIAASLVRRILVDHARTGNASKRGGGAQKAPLDEAAIFSPRRPADMLALDDALSELSAMDERKCRIVELKFFGGLTAAEIASVLDLSEATVRRDWSM
ncbi:MAG TPA: sigma-70 family RNA polymerase sigma factor, partial [Tepidisphaeraceae bacterium]|nr:sigma-70 family RNA polymerase sigma factor [Tepidisphaeraceae bacterium]